MLMKNTCKILITVVALFGMLGQTAAQTPMKFQFGSGKANPGYTQVSALTTYTSEKGYGIDRNTTVTDHRDFVAGDKPFYFSVKVPEGNYDVKVTLGDKEGTSDAAIRAECRRIYLTHTGQHYQEPGR
jgi:hypothetical protein